MAGFWSRLFTRAPVEKDDSIENWFRLYGDRANTASGVSVTSASSMRVVAVQACVRVRAQDMAKLPPRIYQLLPDGSRRVAKKHYLYQLFRRPNFYQTWFEFAEFMQTAMLLHGNAYAAVQRDPRGTPINLIPINPTHVTVFEATGGDVFYQVSRGSPFEVSVLSEFPQRIPSDDIFHLRWVSTGNGLVGISPIALAAEAIGLAKSQERVSANLMGSGARPSGILTTDKKLSDTVIKRFKAQWDSLHGGAESSGKTAVLEEGLKWMPLTLNSVDMEFIASRKLQIEEIARIFGVNPVKLGIMDSRVGQAYEQIQLAHYSDTVHPDLVRWEKKIESYFALDDIYDVVFDETELLRADVTARANAARVLQVSGITTPNESRASFGLDPIDGGDDLYMPVNMMPISKLGLQPVKPSGPSGPGSDQTGAPAPGGSGDATEVPRIDSGTSGPGSKAIDVIDEIDCLKEIDVTLKD